MYMQGRAWRFAPNMETKVWERESLFYVCHNLRSTICMRDGKCKQTNICIQDDDRINVHGLAENREW